MQDSATAFMSGLIDRFIQFKGLQMQNEFARRRERRYERQLQQQAAYQKGMLRIRGEEAEARKVYYGRPRAPTVSIYSPSAVGTLGKTAGGVLEDFPTTKTGGFFGIGATKYVKKSDILKDYKNYQTGIGYQALSSVEQQQADFAFDEEVKRLRGVDKVEWDPDADYDIRSLRPYTRAGIFRAGGDLPGETTPSTFVFKGKTSTDDTAGAAPPLFLQGMKEAQPEDPFEKARYRVGDIVSKGGRRYRVVGFDTDGEPLVEKIP